jgi:hypothetical protein
MARIALNDGRWFETGKAERFDETTWHDGNNHISHATGSQWDHEALWRTAGGKWVLNSWSQWQGSRETYVEISNEDAARWLVKNDLEPHPACSTEYAALELT